MSLSLKQNESNAISELNESNNPHQNVSVDVVTVTPITTTENMNKKRESGPLAGDDEDICNFVDLDSLDTANGGETTTGDITTVHVVPPGKSKRIRLESVPDDFTCAICLETVVSPVILTCSHMYCLKCIEDYIENDGETCPSCRSLFDVDGNFVVNKIIHQIVRGLFRTDKTYQKRIKQHNLQRFVSALNDTFGETLHYDEIRSKIEHYILDHGNGGFLTYNGLCDIFFNEDELKHSRDTSNRCTFCDKLLEFNFVLRELIVTEKEYMWVDSYIIPRSPPHVSAFLSHYQGKLTLETFSCILANVNINLNHGIQMLDTILENYEDKLPDFLQVFDLQKCNEDKNSLCRLFSSPDIVNAITETYRPDIFCGISREKFLKVYQKFIEQNNHFWCSESESQC